MSKVGFHAHPNTAITIAAYLIILAVAKYASSIVTPILLALFIGVILAQPIKWLQQKRVPQGWSILIVLFGTFLIFFGMAELIGRSVTQFSQDAPQYEARFNEITASLFKALHGFGFDVSMKNLESAINPGKIMSYSASFLSALGSIMGNMFLVVFIVIFVLFELNSFSVKVDAIMNTSRDSAGYFTKIGNSIRQYLGLMTIISLLTGVLVWIVLAIIGVKYAVLWALLAFLLNFIPNIGSIIASIPAIIFALLQLGLGGGLWTLGAYVAINMVVGNVIQPQIMGKGLGLSTLVVFISLVFWGYIFGTVGMFLSVPLTMVIKIILEQRDDTKWIAIILGTEEEASSIAKNNKVQIDKS